MKIFSVKKTYFFFLQKLQLIIKAHITKYNECNIYIIESYFNLKVFFKQNHTFRIIYDLNFQRKENTNKT